MKRGFDFTLMVVGEAGLGKSTLVNSLFLSDLYNDRKMPPVDERIKKTVDIQKTTMEIEEKGVKLRLTVVDTPGFGDNLDGKIFLDNFENCEPTLTELWIYFRKWKLESLCEIRR